MIEIEAKDRNTQNYLKAAYFLNPDWIPCHVNTMPATWRKYGDSMAQVFRECPRLFPHGAEAPDESSLMYERRLAEGRLTDNWGCVWENISAGLVGQVVESPLEDWDNMRNWSPPDPITQGDGFRSGPDWEGLRSRCERAKQAGRIATGSLPHGFMFMRLHYLRGYENLMLDLATGEPRLKDLIALILEYNIAEIQQNIDCGVEMIIFGDDLGTQKALPISPQMWRQYMGPCYRRMFGLCREHGVEVYLHSDGHILEIIPDLIEAGVTILNPQIRANGLDGLEKMAKGKVCVRLDLDRQLFPFVGPQQIDEHIRNAVARLNLPSGGLMLDAECEPDVPLENIRAICTTLAQVGGPS